MVSKIFIIGIGPGNPEYLTKRAIDALSESDIVFGAGKVLQNIREAFPEKKFVNEYRAEKIFEMLNPPAPDADSTEAADINAATRPDSNETSSLMPNTEILSDTCKIASVCFSGSINLYSGAPAAIRFFTEKGIEVEEIDGLSSVSYFLSKLHIPENEVKIISIHGRACDVLSQVRTHKYTAVLLSNTVQLIELVKNVNPDGELNNAKIYLGEDLSLASERINIGSPREFILYKPIENTLAIAVFQNDNFDASEGYFLPDSSFVREYGDSHSKKLIPMTKENVRTLALEKLSLKKDSVLWDIGAGTGSVSIAAGKRLTAGKVLAVEKNTNAANLCRKNIVKFDLSNVSVIEGEAPGIFNQLIIEQADSAQNNKLSSEKKEILPISISSESSREKVASKAEKKYIVASPTHAFLGGAGKDISDIVDKLISINPDIRIVATAVTLETISECEKLPQEFPDYEFSFSEIAVTDYVSAGKYHIRKAQNPVLIMSMGPKN